jgi:hypothetical protein
MEKIMITIREQRISVRGTNRYCGAKKKAAEQIKAPCCENISLTNKEGKKFKP